MSGKSGRQSRASMDDEMYSMPSKIIAPERVTKITRYIKSFRLGLDKYEIARVCSVASSLISTGSVEMPVTQHEYTNTVYQQYKDIVGFMTMHEDMLVSKQVMCQSAKVFYVSYMPCDKKNIEKLLDGIFN